MSLSAKLPVTVAAATACVVGLAVAPATSAPSLSAPRMHTVTTSAAAGSSYVSHVWGTFGKAGTVRGHFVPLRSFVRNGKTVVQGDLSATLRRGDGTLVGRATRHDVTLPVHASGGQLHTATATAQAQATCSILHLVLGPLDLNLLGLHVHLNRVVLDITAQSGSGNLLGNLLCAVAHLLDSTSPSLTDLLRLSSLLNRIIGLLT